LIPSSFDKKHVSKFGQDTPLGRPGQPDEVAALVSWLVSDEARYVTGTSVVIDGGALQHVLPPAF
jgi:NAD(P)-dependent dehydrogenase (short-subunit alcohol dehydrogenase family)